MSEVRRGYKQTEVGVIPEDWNLRKLGELVSFLDGRRRPVKDSDRAKMKGNIPYYGASGIVDYVNDFLFDEELILLGEDGENIISRNCRLAFRISGKTWVNNHAHVLKPNQDVNIAFLTDYLESLNYEQLNSGTAQPKLNKQTCIKIPVAVPSTLAEQTAIAEALSDADALIESLEQLLTKKRQIKQGAMQELLTGKKRLPGFQSKPGYKQTEVGVIPEDWEARHLGAIGEFKNGMNKDSAAFGHGHPFINLMDIFGVCSISTNEQLGLVACSTQERAAYDLRRGDVIFVRSSVKPSGVGLTAVIEQDLPETVYSGFLIRFRENGFLDLGFKRHCFYETRFRKALIGSSSVSANTNINQDSLKGLAIPLPPTLPEQTAIATVLSDMDTDIAALETKLTKARQIKQGMMQNLLTGKIRLV